MNVFIVIYHIKVISTDIKEKKIITIMCQRDDCKKEIKSIDVGRVIAQTILVEHQSIRAMCHVCKQSLF